MEPVETLEENIVRGSSQGTPVSNTPIARPPRPARPVPVVQAMKRKEVSGGSEKKSEKSRREELLEMALLNSSRNLSAATPTRGTGSLTHSTPKPFPGTALAIAPVSTPSASILLAGNSSLEGQGKSTNGKESTAGTGNVKGSSPVQKLQVQKKPPLAPKPSNFPPQQTIIKPAVTSSLQTSLNSKQIEALLSAPSIGSPTLQKAPSGGTGTPTHGGTPKEMLNTPSSFDTYQDTSNPKKRTGSVDSSGCNFTLECEVCKTQVILQGSRL